MKYSEYIFIFSKIYFGYKLVIFEITAFCTHEKENKNSYVNSKIGFWN